MQVELVEHYGTDLTVVNAARVSFAAESDWEYKYPKEEAFNYKSLSTKDAKLIHYLAKHKHISCFEHQGATLRLKVPIFIARQIQRHRSFSFNEISRRYVDKEPEFFMPEAWRKRAANVKQGSSDELVSHIYAEPSYADPLGQQMIPLDDAVKGLIGSALRLYNTMLEADVAPEQARMVLPQNMYTEFYMTGNLRSWHHFLQARLDAHAQKEVRDVAVMVQDHLTPLWPVSMTALKEYQ